MDIKNVEELEVDIEKIGPQGYSAYEIAKKYGFEGTEEEYLQSLHGEDGYTPVKGVDYFDGNQGEQGPQGIPGQDGKDGKDGQDAQINGKNTINIVSGNNINIEQDEEGNLIINGANSYDDTELKKNIETRALITETGNKIVLEINNETFVITAKLEDKNGNIISTSEGIDLPLESVVVNANYDDANKQITLTLQNGNTTSFSVADLVNGLVSEDTFNKFKEEINNALENIKVDLPIASADVLGGIKVGESLNIGEDGTLNINSLNVYYRNYPNYDIDGQNTPAADVGYDILPTDPDGLYVCTGMNHSVGLIIHLSTIQYLICPYGSGGVYLFTRNYFTAGRPWQSWNMKGSLSVRDAVYTAGTTGEHYKQAREAVNSVAIMSYVGKLATLKTTTKKSTVDAINELKTNIDTLNTNLGKVNETLATLTTISEGV